MAENFMTAKEWLNDNQLSCAIYERKYRNNGETLDEFFERISGGWEPLKALIKERKFIFGGRILANRGVTGRSITYSNCYVIAPPEDNIESIFECATKLARTYSYGGKTTTLPPYTVMCSKKFSEPVNAGCVFNNMLTVEALIG